VVGFLSFDEEAEQYLVTAVLRPGNAPGSAGAVGILRRLIVRVKEAFPEASIRVRLDGGFASPEILDFLDCEPKVEYIVNLAANAVLKRKAESAMKRARGASESSGQTEHVYGECRYATRKTWPWKRRVIYKAEVVRAEGKEPKDNPRFVVTKPETESAVDLRTGLLLAGRRRKPGQGAARRHADRTDQLLELLGEHVPGHTGGGGVCADAGDAPAPGTDPPRPGTSLDYARTFLEVGRSGGGLGASDRVALTPVLSVSR
jgi:DDE family transposase